MKKIDLIDGNLMTSGTCLYDSSPIPLNPKLAFLLGDSDLAIILQQVHYWLQINKQNVEMGLTKVNTYKEGRIWCFQTYEEWEQQFIWMSLSTIKRKITALESMGLLISGDFNQMRIDRTKWYTIDYKKLSELTQDLAEKINAKQLTIEKRKVKQREHNVKQNSISQTKKAKCQVDTMPKCQVDTTNNKRLTIQEINLQEINLLPLHQESQTKQFDDDDDNLTKVINLFKECINKKISSRQKAIIQELIEIYGKDKVIAAINVTAETATSPNLKYVKNVCKNDSSTKPKNDKFTNIQTHDWDMDEIERGADDFMMSQLSQGRVSETL